MVGADRHAASEALFLSHYSREVTLLTFGQPMALSARDLSVLSNAGIAIDQAADWAWDFRDDRVLLHQILQWYHLLSLVPG